MFWHLFLQATVKWLTVACRSFKNPWSLVVKIALSARARRRRYVHVHQPWYEYRMGHHVEDLLFVDMLKMLLMWGYLQGRIVHLVMEYCWLEANSSATVYTSYTEAQLLFQCQQKLILDQMDHPVFVLRWRTTHYPNLKQIYERPGQQSIGRVQMSNPLL